MAAPGLKIPTHMVQPGGRPSPPACTTSAAPLPTAMPWSAFWKVPASKARVANPPGRRDGLWAAGSGHPTSARSPGPGRCAALPALGPPRPLGSWDLPGRRFWVEAATMGWSRELCPLPWSPTLEEHVLHGAFSDRICLRTTAPGDPLARGHSSPGGPAFTDSFIRSSIRWFTNGCRHTSISTKHTCIRSSALVSSEGGLGRAAKHSAPR